MARDDEAKIEPAEDVIGDLMPGFDALTQIRRWRTQRGAPRMWKITNGCYGLARDEVRAWLERRQVQAIEERDRERQIIRGRGVDDDARRRRVRLPRGHPDSAA